MTATTNFAPSTGNGASHAAWESLTLALPAHWLPALVNDDTSGLDDREAAAFSRWLYDTTMDLGYPIVADYDEEPHFARWHDAAEYGVKACMCHDVRFVYAE
jgi:hypothetical protein